MNTYQTQCSDLQKELVRLKKKSDEQNEMLKTSKATISGLVKKENEVIDEFKRRIQELDEQQQRYKARVSEAK